MMRVRVTFVLFLFCGSFFMVPAQKNSPIAGDAARLIDFLRKDYNNVPMDKRPAEIARDRNQVQSIFNGYLTSTQQEVIQARNVGDTLKGRAVEEASTNYQEAQLRLDNLILESSRVKAGTFETLDTIVGNAETDLKGKRTKYYNALYERDESIFKNMVETLYGKKKDSSQDSLLKNDYLVNMVSRFKKKYKNLQNFNPDIQAKVQHESAIQKSIPLLGGELAFSTVIDGFSRFIAKRLKEELNVYVIGQFQEWLRKSGPGDPLAELKIMMPRTLGYLQEFDADQLTSFPNEIKQFIEDDFNHLLENAANLKDTPRFKRLIKTYPETAFAFEALEFIPQISRMSRPIEYFGLIEHSEVIENWSQHKDPTRCNMGNSLKLSSLLAHSLTVTQDQELRFVGLDFLQTYASEPEFFLLYIGFLHQQNLKYGNIQFKSKEKDDPISLEKELRRFMDSRANPSTIDSIKSKTVTLSTMLSRIGKSSTEVYEQGRAIRKASKRSEKVGADTVFQFIDATIDLAEEISGTGEGFLKLIGIYEIEISNKTKPYFEAAHLTNDIVLDLKKERYAEGILKTLELPGKLIPKRADVLTEVYAIVEGIQKMELDETYDDWRIVLKKVDNENSTRIQSKKRQEAADRLLVQMGPIIDSAKAVTLKNINKNKLKENLETIDTLLKEIRGEGQVTQTTLTELNTLFDTKSSKDAYKEKIDLIKFIVGHYLEIDLFNFSSRLDSAVQVLFQKTGTIINEEDWKKYFNPYIDAGFRVAFMGENPKTSFEKSNRNLVTYLRANLLTQLPHRFNLKIHPNVIRLVSFLNSMATAKDAEDVEKAMEALALPSGSFAIKRKSKFNLSVGTYPGLIAGWGWGIVNDSDDDAENGFSPSFTAPVGLSFAWGSGKNRCVHGFYLSVIDVGALTRFHLDADSDTETLPEVTFENVFSPGVYYTIGLPKVPLSINIGAQYGPELQKVSDDPMKYIRGGVGITVDIPLFNIYTKPRLETL